MRQARTDLIFDPEHLASVPVYKLLEAAGRGYIEVDHRFLHAVVDDPKKALPDLVRFAAEDHSEDPVNLEPELIDIFRVLRAPEAIPFLIGVVRREPLEVEDELVESIAALGAPAVEPLLALLQEVDECESEEVAFLLAALQVRDPRILEALTGRLETNPLDAAWSLDVYGDPAAIPALEAAMARLPAADIRRAHIHEVIDSLSRIAEPKAEVPEPFDIWSDYPKKGEPPLDLLSEEERLAMLESGSPELRTTVAGSFVNMHFSQQVGARLLELAKHDPDGAVRGECWEALQDMSDQPEMRRTMIGVLQDANASLEEKSGAALALAQQCDNRVVFQAIEELYASPRARAKALKAMARSLDRRFAAYPPQHLDDPDPEIKKQAIWCVGYLNLPAEAPRLEAFFDDGEFRGSALFAYALSVPGETSPGRVRALLKKIDDVAGGFRPDEEELVEMALDQRLVLHGRKPVFTTDELEEDEPEAEPAPSVKVGRNDPCPCGSGKKHKKCCGA